MFASSTETPPYTPQEMSVRIPEGTTIRPVREGDFEFEDEEDEVQTTLKKWVPNTYGISMGGSSARSGRSTRIAPVGLGGGGTGLPTFLGDPVLMQMMKNLVQPYFKGRTEEWPKFTIDWDLYLAKLSAGGKISDELKLQLLEPCLNETEKGELQFMIRVSAGQLTFQQFWAKLAARYGEEANACARRRWRELTLNTAGKVTANDWRDLQVRFCEI